MNHLKIPNLLYGREQDLITLMESFERIGRGQGEILLVPGYSGVGKTALVKELQKPVRAKNGFFISGKFDQYKQNIPYFAFRQALAELCLELESGDSLQRDRYKKEILLAIGGLGQLLVDMVPEFESLLGVQPPLGDISPQEARYRFAGVFQNFLKVICLPEHPLVLFIDDWQWADAASFELLKLIQVGITLRYMVIIISYRDNEVNFSHPLTYAMEELRRNQVPVEVLEVKNLTEDDVQKLLIDTLTPPAENISELGAIIYQKTNGNPFFLRSFLSFLYEFSLVKFNEDLGIWQWFIDKINKAKLPNNVVDLFVLKLNRLNKESRILFSVAACLGNRFDLESLCIINGLSTEDCLKLLSSNEAKTMLQPVIGEERAHEKLALSISAQFIFQHDRIQQAAFSLIEKNELPDILLKIGRLLLKSLPPEILAERFFEVVNDLNAGLSLIHDNAERVQIIELNLTAAQKAYSATAYSSALVYCRAASYFIDLPGFEEYFWFNHHDLAMQLFKEIAECEFLEGEVSIAENRIQQALTHARTPIEKANILNILIVQYTLAARYSEAISWGRQALAELGINLPEEGFEEARNQEIRFVRQELGNRFILTLVDLPVMSDPEMLMASKILITIGPPCYRSHQRLWSVIVPKVVNLTLHYGNIPQLGYSHTAFGGLLGWVDSDYSTAKEFGELATRLMTERFHAPSEQSVFYLMIGSSIRHWFKHLKFGTQDYKDAYEMGVQSGNMQYAAYAFGHNMYCRFYQGAPLAGLMAETEQSLEFCRTRLNQWAIDLLEGGLKVFGSLSGISRTVDGNNPWSEKRYLHQLKDHHNIQVECIYKVLRTFSYLMLGKFDRALISSEEAEPLIYTVGTQGLLPWPEHVFARFLILTALYSKTDKKLQSKWSIELDQIMGKLRIWADNCPANFEHKYLLASAEMARINLKQNEAMLLYDLAIEAAQTGNFHQWEGIANERAFSFMVETGNERLAHIYFQQAYVSYKQLGADAKIIQMEMDYRAYLKKNIPVNENSVKPGNISENESLNILEEKKIKQLQNYAFQLQQNSLQVETKNQVEEMTLATQRLRVAMAEKKQAETELIKQKEFFEQVFTQSSISTQILDKEGWCERINPKLSEIFGVKPEHIEGKVYNILKDEGIKQGGVLPQLEKVFNEGKTAEWDVHFDIGIAAESQNIQVKKKQKVWFHNWSYPIFDELGKLSHVIIQHTDISDNKKAEAELELKNEELQKINAEKDKFFSIIAHDLKGPFNSIVGFSDLLADQIRKKNYSGIEKYAGIIQLSSKRAMDLLENLMEWSNSQTGRMEFYPEYFEMVELINETVLLLSGAAEQKSIKIIHNLSPVLPVFADKKMIGTVLRNLISNAIKFTEPGGKISLSAQKVKNQMTVSVQDTGVGIPQDAIDNLFRIDSNYSTAGTQNEKGTGLGLILCKEFVGKHGGKIWVESTIGDLSGSIASGSIFYFSIPNPSTP